jgi:diguanylate cyclase (GGDEF)-like protein
MTNPTTGLPSSRLIEEQLRTLMRSGEWSYLQIGVDNLGYFNDVYGFVAGDEVLRFAALLLNEVVDEFGTLDDFVGHPGGDSFVIITMSDNVLAMVDKLRQRFNEEVLSHYNFMDREQGGITLNDGTLAPLMHLSIGAVSSRTQRFSDIREITEMAAELRRLDQTKFDQAK